MAYSKSIDLSKNWSDIGIESLELDQRTYICLKRAGINTLQDLRNMTPEDFLHVRNLGRRSTEKIVNRINELIGIERWNQYLEDSSNELDEGGNSEKNLGGEKEMEEQSNYLVCMEENILLEEWNPYISLLFHIFGGAFKSNDNVIKNKERIIGMLINTLPDELRFVINSVYGIYGEKEKTYDEIADILCITPGMVSLLERKALRMLRHPGRASVFRGKKEYINFAAGYGTQGRSHKERMRAELREEIEDRLSGGKTGHMYLDAVMVRNGVSIIDETISMDYNEVDIEELGFSQRVYAPLKRAGINTLSDLLGLRDDDFRNMNRLGNRGVQEIKREIQAFDKIQDGLNTVVVVLQNERTVYKYSEEEKSKMSEGILLMLLGRRGLKNNIFDSVFSPGLCELLLLKGYLFEDDVLSDADELIEQLKCMGFTKYAEEILGMKECVEMKLLRGETAYICRVTSEIMQFIEKFDCKCLWQMRQQIGLCQEGEYGDVRQMLDEIGEMSA